MKMRQSYPVLILTGLLLTGACRSREETAAPAPAPEAALPDPERVTQQELSPAPPTAAEQQAQLDARERELAARQAELEERERQLAAARPRPATPRPGTVRPAPRPAPRPVPVEEPAAPEAALPEPEPDHADAEPAPEPEPEPEPAAVEARLPAGTTMDVEFVEELSSATSRVGDTFRVRVNRDLERDGEVAIPGGSEIVGEVTEVESVSRRVGGTAKLGLRFTNLVLPTGETIPIRASLVRQGGSQTGRDAATIGGGAVGGAILGRLLNKGNKDKGSVLGAIVGAAAGAVIASRNQGDEVVLPQGAVVGLVFDREVEIRRRL